MQKKQTFPEYYITSYESIKDTVNKINTLTYNKAIYLKGIEKIQHYTP